MDLGAVAEVLGTGWGYPVLLVLLLLTGIGSPVPEDLLLLVAGYLVAAEVLQYHVTLAVCLAGVVGSDLVLYALGRRLIWRRIDAIESRIASQDRLRRFSRWFDRVGPRAVLIARLVPGTRAIVFIAAGLREIPAGRFLFYSGMGALVWVPVLFRLGRAVGTELGGIEQMASSIQTGAVWMFAAAAVIIAGWLAWGREESKL